MTKHFDRRSSLIFSHARIVSFLIYGTLKLFILILVYFYILTLPRKIFYLVECFVDNIWTEILVLTKYYNNKGQRQLSASPNAWFQGNAKLVNGSSLGLIRYDHLSIMKSSYFWLWYLVLIIGFTIVIMIVQAYNCHNTQGQNKSVACFYGHH